MRIISAASAFPEHRYKQQAITGALKKNWADRLASPDVLDRLHSRTGVDYRHMVLPLQAYERIDSWGKANSLWIEAAQRLAKTALCRAMVNPGMVARELNALIFVSVTGVASPSIDAKLVNLLGLSPNVKRMPIFGLGCVAGAAGVARAADYVRAFPDQIAALVSVELCSLTWQRDDLSVANLISAGLFGDGAAAVLVAGADTKYEGPEILATRSVFYPNTEDVMGWDISEKGFQIVLSADVPKVVREHLRQDVDSFLADHGLTRGDIASWIIHTGGPKVLEAVQDSLELPQDALRTSWDCLRRVGNLSSASVLVVLEDILKSGGGETGTYSVLAAMGPGFCSELLLLRW
ncbi:MAG: 3-oxoacyl-[acyl-carrier-protein] synthase III C-terminal domain-containing protein [Candidatus Korobacteraceae bacterium]